jgi:hypothetical protein
VLTVWDELCGTVLPDLDERVTRLHEHAAALRAARSAAPPSSPAAAGG